MRVHELAKELKTTSKEILDVLKSLKLEAKSHMSQLTEDGVRHVKDALTKPKAKAQEPARASSSAHSMASSLEKAKKEIFSKRISSAAAASTVASTFKKSVTLARAPSPRSITTTAPTPRGSISAPPPPKKEFKPAPPAPRPVTAAPVQTSAPVQTVVEIAAPRITEIATPIAVKDLAAKLNLKPNELMQRLIKIGVFATINQTLNFEIAKKAAAEFSVEVVEAKKFLTPTASVLSSVNAEAKDVLRLKYRAPIVTFMGHVDHGKTSLLDAIRKTKVAAGEAGGITQHIGAYEVFLPKGAITFLDTPGHEAFTAMRARGAKVTDIVVLVVAADDGVMPQTIEAIDHAKAAGVPIVVAINKMDLPTANPERVKKALSERELLAEDWGGKTIMVGVSARTGKGIDQLLEMLVLEAELLELKADPEMLAQGTVVEAELSKESGVLATVLVQQGTLRIGDVIIVGNSFCKVRAMINDRGARVKEAPPSTPVEILGLASVPKAGDHFQVVDHERKAREIVERHSQTEYDRIRLAHVTLEDIYQGVKAGKVEELKLIIKSDVQGSVEALCATLGKIHAKDVRLKIVHTGAGEISESDILLAAASNAVVIGFHVSIADAAKTAAEKELVDVRFYDIIYEAKAAIEKAMEGLLAPEVREVFLGSAEVRQVFKVSKIGVIAGCTVSKGKIVRNAGCRVMRNGQKIHEGKIQSLKRFKDDAREVLEGFECGIGVSNFDEYLAGDRVETYEIQTKERKLE